MILTLSFLLLLLYIFLKFIDVTTEAVTPGHALSVWWRQEIVVRFRGDSTGN